MYKKCITSNIKNILKHKEYERSKNIEIEVRTTIFLVSILKLSYNAVEV